MKNQITLTNETIEELKTLYNNIDGERDKSVNDYNLDLVTESQFRILDIVKELVFTKKTIEVPTVILKIHLYDTDKDGNYIPMDEESTEEVIKNITSADDVMGYSITDYEVTTEEIEIPN